MIRPAILWNDQRSAPQCAVAGGGTAGWIACCGSPVTARSPDSPLRSCSGCASNEPAGVRRGSRGSASRRTYVRDRLVGGHRMDVADASGTLLLDVGARRWSASCSTELDIPRRGCPTLRRAPTRSERSTASSVAAGAGDQAAAAVGAGITGPGPLSVVLGTSGVVLAATDRFPRRPRRSRARLLPCRPAALAGDGRDARRPPARWHGSTTRCSPAMRLRRDARRGRARSARLRRARLPPVPRRRADAARRPATRAARSAVSSLSHGRGALTRSVLEGVAFATARLPRHRPRRGRRRRARSRVRGRVGKPSLARRSSRASSSCRSRSWRRTRARRSAPRCSAASPPECTATSTRPAAACVRVTDVDRSRRGLDRAVSRDAAALSRVLPGAALGRLS